ncbi:hypothetical protein DPV78_005293 [Talaromyces pinophilus]|nr:hypothetical protein DPV78_005293 [Talaromyces pinophilus]
MSTTSTISTYRDIWNELCGHGVVGAAAVYGGTTFHFMEAIKNPRWEDFNIDRLEDAKANRFAYLGDGFTHRETKGGSIGTAQTIDFEEYWRLFVLPDIHN